MREVEDVEYKCLGILQLDQTLTAKMKAKISRSTVEPVLSGHPWGMANKYGGGGGVVLPGILGRDVQPGFPISDPISDQNKPFFTPIFRPGLALLQRN